MNKSYIDFGTPNPEIMSSPDDITWIDVLYKNEEEGEDLDPWWTNEITGIQWDEKLYHTAYILEEKRAFTDTGTSCIMGPLLMIQFIKN